MLQTKTWRSLQIYDAELDSEIASLARRCNETMEEFVKIETLRVWSNKS